MQKTVAAAFIWVASCTLTTNAYAAGNLKQEAIACDNIKDFQVRIAGCTALLKNPKLPAKYRPGALLQRAQGYIRGGQAPLALPDLDEAIRLSPNNADIYISRGSVYLFLGPMERAIEDANKALKLNPKQASAYSVLAQAYNALGGAANTDHALDAINKGMKLNPKLPTGLAVRAHIWVKKKEFAFALADADENIKLNGQDPVAYSHRCSVFSEMGSFDAAIADCTKSLEMRQASGSANASPIFHDRAAVYFRKGDFDKAMTDFDQSLRLDPQNAASYVERAEVWRAKGNLDKAIEDVERGLRINSRLAKAYTARGLLHEAKGDIESARRDYKTAAGLPLRVGTQGYRQYFIDDSEREIGTAKARLSALDQSLAAPSSERKAEIDAVGKVTSSKRIALVIGNSAYKHATPLANPANDAKSIARNLRDIGFEVFDGLDLDRDSMKAEIAKFIRVAAAANIAVLFYAGHGMQIDGRNYLVPVDANFGDGRSIAADMTDLDFILAGLDDKLRTNIIILDACRDNPMLQTAQAAGASRSVTVRSGLAAPAGLGTGGTVGAGTLLAFATAPGQVALDGDGSNSPFSTALARHIGTPGIEVQQMLTRVRSDVVAATKTKQVPWSNSSLLGEVFLVSTR